MYKNIVDDDPYETPMMIYPASHYTMGGLWVDYELQSNIPGLFVLGEANFSDHGANRLGASALMQGLADGYFIIPYTVGPYLSQITPSTVDTDQPEFKESINHSKEETQRLMSINGKRTADTIHRELGAIMVDHVGMARNGTNLKKAIEKIQALREEFWKNLLIPGSDKHHNLNLQKAGRLKDFLEFAELMAFDALDRDESCGCHFREEHQTEEGEAKRNDTDFSYVSAWEYKGQSEKPVLQKEPLVFENVEPTRRSYK
jgi:succinate dehydrogenase / fumarate reductase flavoprotein subunit